MLVLFRRLVFLAIICFSLAALAALVTYLLLAPNLPKIDTLKDAQLQVPLRIFTAEGKLIAEFGNKRRIPLRYDEFPPQIIQAILASEDDRFFEHPGVDYHGILRAVYSLATTGQKAQGGSTITMQVARNFFLTNEKTYTRKLNEMILSLQIEQSLSKEEILSLYLNKIYLGKRSYGVGAAAVVYYGKPLQELSLAQFAMIAGLPKAPSKYNPIVNPDRAKLRRDYVLRRMWQVGYISEADYLTAKLEPLSAQYHSREVEVYAPYIAEMVRTKLIKQYGDDTYSLGLNVYTTIQAKHQQVANTALQSALLAYDKRHGYRGAQNNIVLEADASSEDVEQALSTFSKIGPLHPSIVTEISDEIATLYIKDNGYTELNISTLTWAQKQLSTNSRGPKPKLIADVFALGDVVYLKQDPQQQPPEQQGQVQQDQAPQWQLAQVPEVEGALIAVSPFDGAVTALNGGFEYFQNKFNRVTQSHRQPGSGFKPFIYSAALEKGYTAASIINDAPVVFDSPELDNVWRPENYSGKFFGPTRLRVALTHSRNLVSIRLLRDIGAKYVIKYAGRFGFDTSQMPPNLSLALGSGSAAPWDMARAYSALANGGYRIEPYVIQRVEDAAGIILMQAQAITVCETCVVAETQEEAGIEGQVEEATEEIEDTLVDELQSIIPAKRIMTAQNNTIMNSLLRDVVRYGTGRKAMRLGRGDLAGKTGTTNDQVDAWFNGFHPDLVAIAWVGFDSPKTLGRYETGGRAALPMWIDFMKVALNDVEEEPLQQTVDMVTVKIDPKTGLLARSSAHNAIYETFRKQYVPTETVEEVSIVPSADVKVKATEIAPSIDLF